MTFHMLNHVKGHSRAQALASALVRGRLVKESVGFTLREMGEARSSRVYRVREDGMRVLLQHGTPDVLTFDQAYLQHVYEPPEPVVALLEGLGRPLRAVDLGANVGMWGLWFHGRFPVAQVTALEPDPENVSKHRRQIAINHLGESWEVIEAAATCRDGPVHFTTGLKTTGRISEEGEQGANAVAGRDAFALLEDVDLLKIDVEGAEWQILADPRSAELRVPVVMLEHHPHEAPSGNPAGDASKALQAAGYSTMPLHGASDGSGMVWGWH